MPQAGFEPATVAAAWFQTAAPRTARLPRPAAMYGSETWTINSLDKKRIEAFEMWCYRRMLKIRWVDRITNEEVLNRIGEKRNLWHNLTRRRDRLVGHVLRHQGLTNLVLEGCAEGKNHRGRPRDEYTKQIQRE